MKRLSDIRRAMALTVILLASHAALAQVEDSTAVSRQRQKPKTIIRVGVGPMWTTSKLYYTEGGDYVSNYRGTGFGASLSYMAGGWYGIGADFYGCYTQLEQSKSSYYIIRGWNYQNTQLYFGPSFVCGGMLTDRLRLESALGLGLAIHNADGDDTKAGLGFRFSLGVELRLSQYLGLGIEGMTHRLTYSKPDDIKIADDEFYGFQQIGFLVGLRCYL